jgi:hypothetical protein
MNILLNSTLVLQIIHFIIAYVIIRCIFLRPAVALILAKEKKRADMRNAITHHYVLIDREKEALQKNWHTNVMVYQEHAPMLEEGEGSPATAAPLEIDYPQVSDAVAQELIAQTTQELVKKVREL